MTTILRNALLAAVAISSMAGSAFADSQAVKTECDKTITNDFWNGRCCGTGNANCMGGDNHDHDRGDNRGDNGRGRG